MSHDDLCNHTAGSSLGLHDPTGVGFARLAGSAVPVVREIWC